LITDNQGAQAIERAKAHGIEYHILQPSKYESKEHYYLAVTDMLKKKAVGLVVLAGFMRIVGKALIDAFPNRIMNIHPALLPSFPGLHGQGQAVAYGVRISGCTVHFVDEGMDTGPVIIQAAVPVSPGDTEADLSEKILSLEHKIYPEAIKLFAEGRLEVKGRSVTIKGYVPPENELINPPVSPD
jgi:phosphoribosylglycinamide formyltransferase-1